MQSKLCLCCWLSGKNNVSLVVRKPVFWALQPGQTQTRLCSHRRWLEAWNLVFRKKRDCTICVAKTKALISFAVTAKLICVFVFTFAKIRFSHVAGAHMSLVVRKPVFGLYNQVRHKQGFTIAEGGLRLKFWFYEVELLYYLCSENNDASQLCSYCTADLCL